MAATVTHVLTQTIATNSLLNNLAGGMLVGGVLFGAGQTAATLAGIRALQREKATKDQMDKYMKQVSKAADVASKNVVTDVSNIISSQLLSMTFLTKNINQVVARISLAFQFAYPNANKTEIDGMLAVFKTELNKNVVQENKILTQASLQGQVKIGALPPPLPEPMNNGNGNNVNPPPPPPPPDINPDQFNKKLKKKKKMYGLNINANTYNFEDGYISVATYIQYVRGKIAFEDFVNLVNAGINGWYLADYQAIQYIQTFPKLVYRVWNLIGKSNDSKVQSIQQLLKGWILSQITTVIQQAKRTLILIDTIVDSFPSWLELKVPNKYVTEEDDDKFTFIRASHEKQSLAIVLLAINCVLSLTQWHVFLINFSDILAQIYSSQYIIPWAQIRRIWKTSCFNIQKTSFYLENTRRKKYQVQEIAVEGKKIVPITHLEQKKKNWKQSYEQAYDEIKKKEKSISNYNTIVKDIKNKQYQFGEFSKFAVALQQYKQYQYKDIDNLIKEAFQSHFKAIQKSKCFDTKVQNILQSSWKQLTATIPAIRSLDDFQQFSVQPVGFFIEHMILPLNVFDLKSLLYQYIRSLIEFNMYVRIQGRALHSKYLKIDYQQVITGDYYIPIDDDYIFMRKSDRSIYYQINDKIIKKGQKLMLTFDQIKLIYETLKKYLKQKESKITMKALHQRIRIFMIKMGSDVRTLDEYFSKEQDKVIEGIQKVFNISLQQAKKNYNNLGTDVPQTAST